MNRRVIIHRSASLLLPAFLGIQVIASFSQQNLYPFSPYRMFSRHWPDGVQMARVSLMTEDGKRYRPWDLIPLPFFQANHISFSSYLDPAPSTQKEAICKVMKSNLPAPSSITVVGESVRMERVENGVKETVTKSEVAHVCAL